MVAADIEHGIAAEKIEISGVIHIIQVSAFRSGIDLVETDYALGRDERSINVPMMQLVVFTQPCRDDFLQIKRHMQCSLIYRSNANVVAAVVGRPKAKPVQRTFARTGKA